MGSEDVAEVTPDDNDVVLFEVGRGGFSLFTEAQVVGISGEEGLSCKIADREHKIN